jgi:hypothetical protein
MNKKIYLPELDIQAQDNKLHWREIASKGSGFPSSMWKTDSTFGTTPEITFGFEMGADYPLMYFRSPLVRDIAFEKLRHAKEYSKVRLGRDDFFKSVTSRDKNAMVSSMQNLDLKDIFQEHINKRFGSLSGLNKEVHMDKPLTNELFNSIIKDKFDASQGINKRGLVVQLCNALEKPKFPGSEKIPSEMFWWYFISNLKTIKA